MGSLLSSASLLNSSAPLSEKRNKVGRAITRYSPQMLLVRQGFHARQFLAFQEFQRSAAAGGDVGNLVGYAGLVDGAHRVAAADDRGSRLVGCNRLGDSV